MAKLRQTNLFNFFKSFTMNLGPQHPAAHGVLRLVIELDGEFIKNVDPHIGLLHRGTEKLLEYKTFLQGVPYFDRLDYVSTMCQEHLFCSTVEKLFNLPVSFYSRIIRVIFLELTRILNHLLAVTTHALDVGALTPFLWGFEEREKLLEFYERVSGSRLHTCFFKPGGLAFELPLNLLNDVYIFCDQFQGRLFDIEELLSENRIWQQRLCDVGVVSWSQSLNYGFSGVMLRGSGYPWDLRLNRSYEVYDLICPKIIIGELGDCYDRYLCRLYEMHESLSVIKKCLGLLNDPVIFYSAKSNDDIFCSRFNPQETTWLSYILSLKTSLVFDEKNLHDIQEFKEFTMEELILYFKYYTENFYSLKSLSDVYYAVEAPKGETALYVFQKSSRIYRCKIKAPGFLHLQGLPFMVKNHLLADLVTVIGTQDIVFGEIDR